MAEAKSRGREKPAKIEQRKVKGRSEDWSEDFIEGNPVAEGTTRRGTATPVHRPQRPEGSTHCLFYLRSSLWSSDLPLTFLCSIFAGFSLPCLLATHNCTHFTCDSSNGQYSSSQEPPNPQAQIWTPGQ